MANGMSSELGVKNRTHVRDQNQKCRQILVLFTADHCNCLSAQTALIKQAKSEMFTKNKFQSEEENKFYLCFR